ncbi:MAG TPA: YifB family Mg chelatase-like AAA ATPase [Candidatus Nanopelagicales bacterium]|nr:YifB family Mg chelatase-like AAA ATPase [Candidatus Nanopelagicales bacterium]
MTHDRKYPEDHHSRWSATALSLSLFGLEVHPIRVTVAAEPGKSAFHLVGVSDTSAREIRIRVCSACQALGIQLDAGITVTFDPDAGGIGLAHLDLPVVAAGLAAGGWVPAEALEGVALLGELSTQGAVRPVRGVLPALRGARVQGITRAIVPRGNAREAANVDMDVRVVSHLNELVSHLKGEKILEEVGKPGPFLPEGPSIELDLATIRGQHAARRALEIAAAGGHHLLLVGPPGGGKMLLARRLPDILPPLTNEQAFAVTAIRSIAGLLKPEQGLVTGRPFRAPYQTVSAAGLVGGGDPVRPGEASLAHEGVLLLDELQDFRLGVLDALGMGVLPDKQVTLARHARKVGFPARFLLVGALNPCPCGFAGDKQRPCSCSPARIEGYWARLPRSILDHIDVQARVMPIEPEDFSGTPGECSAVVRARVMAARVRQHARAEAREVTTGLNAELTAEDLERVATPDDAGRQVLAEMVERHHLSAAARGKVLRVARTIADLGGSEAVRAVHVAEALQVASIDCGPPRG